ncbi:hypothetical protein APICC_10081 [Apis cerana cerana]|uniref:Ig-like domain-containing protein n=1 Tax=Apis cerana cerana TaxID=94128 RepID=A0A2A3EUI5_APICC|nr:hypothetical protein APICC_10081 [Apis cerana cerana]
MLLLLCILSANCRIHFRVTKSKWDYEPSYSGSESSVSPRHCISEKELWVISIPSSSIHLLRIDVPSIADPRWEKVALRCEYDLDGEELYSVKWYKDGLEFFRFMPGSRPPGRDFQLEGVYVDVNKSDSKQVTLLGQANNRRVKVNLVGLYGCEVSSEGPNFLTIFGEANMSLAIPPKERPTLRGLRPSYEAGETLQVECSSAASYPPARLVFILNGKEG